MENEQQKIHLYSEGKAYKLYNGNMLDMLEVIEPNSIDAIVTDPPYELGFMNKSWDSSGIAFQKETWEKCLKVLKPGGHLLCFGGSRTHHRVTVAIEDAGFEIRDCIMYLFGSGFPKSMNIGLAIDKKNGVESKVIGHSTNGTGAQPNKLNNHTHGDTGIGYADGSGREFDIKKAQNEWDGWGTQLKPAYESIIVARKPCEGSCVENVMKYGVGGINIDECRVPTDESIKTGRNGRSSKSSFQASELSEADRDFQNDGRFPSNVILTYDETDFEEVCGGMPESEGCKPHRIYSHIEKYEGWGNITQRNGEIVGYADNAGSAARYFYCAKASVKDRDEGCEEFPTKQCVGGGGGIGDYLEDVNSASGKFGSEKAPHKNIHPTVKPTALMQYLIRLVTPKGGTILDPFNGSGSTGKAAMYENNDRNADYKYIGIELTPEYLPISEARIQYAIKSKDIIPGKSLSASQEKLLKSQMSLFDLPE